MASNETEAWDDYTIARDIAIETTEWKPGWRYDMTCELDRRVKAYAAHAREALDTPEGVLAAMEGIARYFGEGQSYSWYDDHCASKGHNLNVTPLSDGELRYTVFWPEAKATRDEALALIGQEMGGKTE